MSDQSEQPTQEEIEAYYAQLREVPAGEVLMQAIGMVAGAAEAKLGRPDARPMIDALGALVQIGTPHLGEAASQLQSAVAQLQTAQVQMEKQAGTQQGEADAGEEQTDDQSAGGAPTPPPAQQRPQPGSAGGQASAADKLWIPGRD